MTDEPSITPTCEPAPLWEELAVAARRGEQESFDRSFARLHPLLERLVERHMSQKLRAVMEPSDVVQQVSIVVFRGILSVSFAREAAFKAWLEQIVRTQLIDLMRRHFETQRHGNGAQSLEETVGGSSDGAKIRRGDGVAGKVTGPATRAFKKELAEKLRLVLGDLPELYAAVLRMRVLEGRDTKEVAEELGKTEGAIRQLQQRALAECRSVLVRRQWLRPLESGEGSAR